MKKPVAPVSSAPSDPNLDDEINEFLTEEGPEGELGGEGGAEAPEGSKADLIRGKATLDSWDRMIYDQEEQKWERQIRIAMIRGTSALMLVGESGVGKTTMMKNMAAKYLETPIAYFNAPNMDPFIHLIGVPHVKTDPKTEELVLAFVKKSGIEQSELLILDEMNRVPASTQNALFELVNAQEINGEKIGKVRMVWGAMNPPRGDIEVSVEKLERAFQGRFKKVIPVLAAPKMRHYVGSHTHIGEHVARICMRWWYQLIKGKKEGDVYYQDIVTPRVLEYIMETIQFLEDWKMGKADPRLGKMTRQDWSDEFETVCQHHKLSEDTAGVKLPFDQLIMAFEGREMYGLEDLLDTSPVIEEKLKEIQTTPEAGKMAASVILSGIKGDRLQPVPLIPFYRIGEFSRVLTTMKASTADIVINGKPEVAGFLAAKCLNDEKLKRDYSKGNMEHPVWKPATPGEMALFNHLKYPIMQAVKRSASKAAPKGPAAPGAPKPPGVP